MQGLFAYPDLVAVCGALQFHDQVQDVLLNPKVIVDVLSPSTEAFDRGEKFHRYHRLLRRSSAPVRRSPTIWPRHSCARRRTPQPSTPPTFVRSACLGASWI
jgi:hypothetical protein